MKSSNPLGGPRISISGARAAYIGPGLDLEPHRNVATTVALALGSPFLLRFLVAPGDEGPFDSTSVAVIPSGSLHHLRSGGPMAFVYLDALSDDCRRLQASDLVQAQDAVANSAAEVMASWGVDDLCRALGIVSRAPADRRIGDAVRRIDERPQDVGGVKDLAASAGLSPSRFQFLFRQTVGVPFRRYRLWRRMALVMRSIAAGASLTDAALQAGFASSAHLSTAFKTMFGVTPSGLAAMGVRLDIASPPTRG